MQPGRTLALLASVLCVFLFVAPTARADVRDNAGIFKPETVQQANDTIRQIKQKYNRDLLIETYPKIPDNLQGEFQAKGKDAFFNSWAVARGREASINGVVVPWAAGRRISSRIPDNPAAPHRAEAARRAAAPTSDPPTRGEAAATSAVVATPADPPAEAIFEEVG